VRAATKWEYIVLQGRLNAQLAAAREMPLSRVKVDPLPRGTAAGLRALWAKAEWFETVIKEREHANFKA
jgi:hypothetical protein